MMNRMVRGYVISLTAVVLCLVPAVGFAQESASISGVVLDPLGDRVTGATVTLVGERGQAAETRNDAEGRYQFQNVAPGRYQVVASAPGFDAFTSAPIFVGTGGRAIVDLRLQLGALQQAVTVTAAATELSLAQTGAPVTVLDSEVIEGLNKPDVLEALRLVPGAVITQTGARGGTASFFVRGGNSNFSKVLVDGIPVNQIGGSFDFAQLSTAGVDRVEVMRQTNSVVYGSDAIAGVVAVDTRRGRTRIPEVEYSLDGGNLGTLGTGASVGGAVRRFDYFSQFSHFRTDNDLPNNEYRNDTFAGRFGVALGRKTDLSGSIRYTDSYYESPNGIRLYAIPDDSFQDKQQAFVSVSARSQWTDRWQSTVRFGWTDEESTFTDPAPTGTPSSFGDYLGDVVTVTGANGFSVTGRAILNFGFPPFPQVFPSATQRRLIAGDTTTQLASWLGVTAGARFEHERAYSDPDEEPIGTRNNGGVFGEARVSIRNRAYINGGVGYERNAAFENAFTPRISVAAYLRQPTNTEVGETKLSLNAGTGIKAPAVYQEQGALFSVVQGTPLGSTIDPIGAERSRNFDIGIEQAFWRGNARARIAYFHNTFTDLIEFLGRAQLLQIGIPPAVVDMAVERAFGAYANTGSYRARGIEASSEVAVSQRLRLMGSYTFLDAEITEALTATVSENPAFPGVDIGAFQALVGERPFQRPTHAGALMVMYTQGPAQVSLAGHFVGKRDASTFLSDEFYGDSLLLPNQGMAEGYSKFDLSGSYAAHERLSIYATIENLFDREYEPAFGFPALPLTARVGVRVRLGGD